MIQSHIFVHLVFFLAITFLVLPDIKNEEIQFRNDEEAGRTMYETIVYLQWGHLITFIVLMLKSVLKLKGFENIA